MQKEKELLQKQLILKNSLSFLTIVTGFVLIIVRHILELPQYVLIISSLLCFFVVPALLLSLFPKEPHYLSEEQIARQAAVAHRAIKRSEDDLLKILEELRPLLDLNENYRDFVQSLINDAESQLEVVQRAIKRLESDVNFHTYSKEIGAEVYTVIKQFSKTQKDTLLIKYRLQRLSDS